MKDILIKSTVLIASVVILFAAFGCGGSGGTSNATTVGAAGGIVKSADGNVSINIPAGALTSDTVITITPLSLSDLPAGVQDFLTVNTVYLLEPEGLTFTAPARITMSVPGSAEDLPARFIMTSSGADVFLPDGQEVSYNFDGKQATVSASLNHFSKVWDNLPLDGGVRVRFSGIPSSASVGTRVFRASATVTQVETSQIRADAVLLLDNDSAFPISTSADASFSSEPSDDLGILDAGRAQTLSGSLGYDCKENGTGEYRGKLEFSQYNLTALFASAGFVTIVEATDPGEVFLADYTSTAQRTVTCGASEPTPTATPEETEPTPEPTEEPTATPEPTDTCEESAKVCPSTGNPPACISSCMCDDGFPIGSCEAICLDTGLTPTQCDTSGVGCPGGEATVCPG